MLEQEALASHGLESHSLTSEHEAPSPEYPALQVQTKPPYVGYFELLIFLGKLKKLNKTDKFKKVTCCGLHEKTQKIHHTEFTTLSFSIIL